MRIYVKTCVGQTVCLSVRDKDTVGTLKERLTLFHPIPPERQVLFLNNTPLIDNEATLESLGITKRSVLLLNHQPTEKRRVEVHIKDRVLNVWLWPLDEMKRVKVLIERETGIPIAQQRLLLHGRQIDDDDKLIEISLPSSSPILFLFVLRHFTGDVQVEMEDGRRIAVRVKSEDTVAALKTAISQKEKVPISSQALFLRTQPLSSDNSSLYDCGVVEGSLLHLLNSSLISLSSDPFQFFVLSSQGNLHVITSRSTDTISQLKAVVKERERGTHATRLAFDLGPSTLSGGSTKREVGEIKVERKRDADLHFSMADGVRYKDTSTLSEVNIHALSLLPLFPPSSTPYQIFVRISDGSLLCFEVRMSENVSSVLKRALELDELRSLVSSTPSSSIVPISSFAITASSTMLFVDPSVAPASPSMVKSGPKTISSPNTQGYRLVLHGKVLKEGRSLVHYQVGENMILDLISTSTSVTLQISISALSSSKTVDLVVKSSDLIRDVLSRLEEMEGSKIPFLFARGKKLKEQRSVGHYHLEDVVITANADLQRTERGKRAEKESESNKKKIEDEEGCDKQGTDTSSTLVADHALVSQVSQKDINVGDEITG